MVKVINHYCGHEAGVRNLRKCLDRIFRKIVAKIEAKKIHEDKNLTEKADGSTEASENLSNENVTESAPIVYEKSCPIAVVKEY